MTVERLDPTYCSKEGVGNTGAVHAGPHGGRKDRPSMPDVQAYSLSVLGRGYLMAHLAQECNFSFPLLHSAGPRTTSQH